MKTYPFDAAKYLSTDEDRAELLAEAEATGDAGYIESAKAAIARSLSKPINLPIRTMRDVLAAWDKAPEGDWDVPIALAIWIDDDLKPAIAEMRRCLKRIDCDD